MPRFLLLFLVAVVALVGAILFLALRIEGKIYVVVAALCALVGLAIGSTKERPVEGFFAGALLSVLGVIFMLLRDDARAQCPACKSRVVEGATKCPYCGTNLPPGPAAKPVVRARRPKGYRTPGFKLAERTGAQPSGEESPMHDDVLDWLNERN